MVLDITHLMIADVTELPPTRDLTLAFRPLSFDEIVTFAEDVEFDLDSTVANRLLGNLDVCIGVFESGSLAGYYWLALDSIEAIHNSAGSQETGVPLSFPSDAVFAYKALIHPSYRGRGLYEELVRAAGQWARQNLGSRYLISTSDWTNRAALRSCQRQGLHHVGRIWRFGFRFANTFFTFGPQQIAFRHGIQFGRQAKVVVR